MSPIRVVTEVIYIDNSAVYSQLKQVIWQMFLSMYTHTRTHTYFISSPWRLAAFPGELRQQPPTLQTAETLVGNSICVVPWIHLSCLDLGFVLLTTNVNILPPRYHKTSNYLVSPNLWHRGLTDLTNTICTALTWSDWGLNSELHDISLQHQHGNLRMCDCHIAGGAMSSSGQASGTESDRD